MPLMDGAPRPRQAVGFGMALGGGTARAYAHVGVLQALERRGHRPAAMAGTSSGALFGAMYALGMSAWDLEHVARQVDVGELWRQALDPGLDAAALVRGRRLEGWLDRKVFGGATFADVRLPFAVACTDLASGQLVVVREGGLARAVVASCALPGIFAPVLDGGRALVDGGFVESVPFAALAALGPFRPLGVHAGIDARRARFVGWVRAAHASAPGRWVARWLEARRGRNPWSRLGRGLVLAGRSYEHAVRAPVGGWLLATRPPIAWWDFHRPLEAVRAGVRAVEEALAGEGLDRWLAEAGAPAPGAA